MFYELTWLGVVLLALGILVLAGPAAWLIRRALRERAELRERHSEGRSNLNRRLAANDERP